MHPCVYCSIIYKGEKEGWELKSACKFSMIIWRKLETERKEEKKILGLKVIERMRREGKESAQVITRSFLVIVMD